MPPRDLCKGFRECYKAVMKAVVLNPIVAGFCMGIPTYFLLSGLLFKDSILVFTPESQYLQNSVSGPYYTLLAFTILAWFIELLGIKFKMPNLLSLCAFCHAAIGSWWLVNFVIIFFAGWSYIAFRLMWVVLMGLLTPSVIWHITGDIIRAYKKKLIDEIAGQCVALAQQEIAFRDVEIGAGKVITPQL